MEIGLKFKGRKIVIKNVKEARGFNKFRGLMFKSESQPLLFKFNKMTKQPIHSLFCPEFVAIWLDENNKIVEIKKVKPWHFSIKPSKAFSKLIEIPINDSYAKIIKNLIR